MIKYALLFTILLTSRLTTSAIIPCIDDEIFMERICPEVKVDKINYYYEKMAMLESSNNYDTVNSIGYMGKYQFGKSTLRLLIKARLLNANMSDIKKKNFIKNRELQEEAMKALTKDNLRVLKNYKLIKYVGTKVGGVRVTREGMLAAAHLRGCDAVKDFLRSGGKTNKKDANSTSVRDYMKEFENV